jgi:alkylation response protein AidB-like acyl-CoA dehydrogenase
MVTERAIRLAGGRGILKELPLERWLKPAGRPRRGPQKRTKRKP